MSSEKRYKPDADNLTKIPPPTAFTQTFAPPSPGQPKYIFIGFFVHGEYNGSARPHSITPHASKSMWIFDSVPKLMTFMNCSPGNVLIGETGDGDNTRLTNYFKTNSNNNFMANINQNANDEDQDQIIAKNFLTHVKSGLKEISLNPRDNIEKYKIDNKTDNDVCRNSYICNNQVGISHTFINKTFTTKDPVTGVPPEHWGIFIYNNNCGIEPGTNIESISGMPKYYVTHKNGNGYDFYLSGIVSTLQNKYGLTDKDYLFLFDYTCSKFKREVIEPNDLRGLRREGNNVAKAFGFTGKKRKGTRGGKKKTQKNKSPR
jgi:hypothetical protein